MSIYNNHISLGSLERWVGWIWGGAMLPSCNVPQFALQRDARFLCASVAFILTENQLHKHPTYEMVVTIWSNRRMQYTMANTGLAHSQLFK